MIKMRRGLRLVKRGGAAALLLIVSATGFLSCGRENRSHADEALENGAESIKYASNLQILERPGYTEVRVRNPWDTLKTLRKYILVDRDSVLPESLPAGTVIRVPVANSLVYSTVHAGLISDLGASAAIGGVCNPEYIKNPELVRRIENGQISDCGNSMNPDIEKVIKLKPEIIMLSSFENNDKYARIGELGIPVIECADYMETSPLGRVEWVKFYSKLFGKSAEGDRMFDTTEQNYLALKEKVRNINVRPKVLTDMMYGSIWHVPAAESTIGRLIEDAGGRNPFEKYNQSGSVPLAPERVLALANDAEVWLLRYHSENEKTLASLSADNPVYSRFKAFKDGNVYGCNTRYIDFYEETPFHPDRLLEDMIRLIHPDVLNNDKKLHYFSPMR